MFPFFTEKAESRSEIIIIIIIIIIINNDEKRNTAFSHRVGWMPFGCANKRMRSLRTWCMMFFYRDTIGVSVGHLCRDQRSPLSVCQ